MTPWPAVVWLPYSFVWFEPAEAHVHLFVSWLGLTPTLPDEFGVPEQLSNFEPPGVIFVVEDADALAPAPAFVCELLEACSSLLPWPRTLTPPFTLALPFSLALPLAWSSLSAETDADVDSVAEAEDEDDSSAFFCA